MTDTKRGDAESQSTTHWRVVHVETTGPDKDGLISFTFGFVQRESGNGFVVTVTGPGKALTEEFVGALRCAVHKLVQAAGGSTEQNGTRDGNAEMIDVPPRSQLN